VLTFHRFAAIIKIQDRSRAPLETAGGNDADDNSELAELASLDPASLSDAMLDAPQQSDWTEEGNNGGVLRTDGDEHDVTISV
jgi:hypothetical protein